MKHVIKHELGQVLARKTVLEAWNEYQTRFSKYRPTLSWKTENNAVVGFAIKGISFRGSFVINSANIEVELDVPLVMRPFKSLALAAVQREVERWIAKAKAGTV